MPELRVNISETAHQSLLKLAETSGESIQTVLDRAIENYRKYIFLVEANQAFTALRQNDQLWQEELAERQVWDQTMGDGVDE